MGAPRLLNEVRYPERIAGWGGLEGVDDDFLAFAAVPSEQSVVRYLFTHVFDPEGGTWTLDIGGADVHWMRAWVNGEAAASTSANERHAQAKVQLQEGWSRVRLRIAQPGGEAVRVHAAFFDPASPPEVDPYVPLLRWFREPQRLRYDIAPERAGTAAWYRFTAPPGLRSMRMTLRATTVEAWVDGNAIEPRPACDSGDSHEAMTGFCIELPSSIAGLSQVALRVGPSPGHYAGAVFQEPVSIECEQGEILLGDWCHYGLETYSGGAVYSRTVSLDRRHLEGAVHLDLGDVVTVAEVSVNGRPAGVKMARPFRFDVTELVAEGVNVLEVKVANTLANHMSTYPTSYVLAGQTVSGLLGPVHLEFGGSGAAHDHKRSV